MSAAGVLPQPLEGGCLCGAVTITLHQAEAAVDVCHCAMCQKWTGAMYAGISAQEVAIAGEDHVATYRSSGWASRAFCRTCGSCLWYEFLPTGSRTYLAGLFDLPADLPIKHQIFIDEKPGWYDLAQLSPMKTGAETIAEAREAGFTFE